MNSETNHEDSVEELEESMKELDAIKNNVVSPQLKQIANTLQMMNDAVVSAIQSNVMKVVMDAGHRIAELVSSVRFYPMLKKFSEAIIPIKYINLLNRLKWPVFLINDDALRQDILTACATQDDEEAVKEIVLAYCSDDFLKTMEDDWNSCEVISAERKPILSKRC